MIECLETKRLLIRRFSEEDWKNVLYYTSDPEVMKYLPENSFDENKAKDFIRRNIYENTEEFPVILKDEDKLIGHIVFHCWYEPFKTWEIGWVFNKEYQGNGYASEAAAKFLEYAFEILKQHRIIATCDPRNVASYKVMEKLGMRREGHNIKCVSINNEWLDEYFYAILDEEWILKNCIRDINL